jgi:hypothetical protein
MKTEKWIPPVDPVLKTPKTTLASATEAYAFTLTQAGMRDLLDGKTTP